MLQTLITLMMQNNWMKKVQGHLDYHEFIVLEKSSVMVLLGKFKSSVFQDKGFYHLSFSWASSAEAKADPTVAGH